jgi:hypothetical protein
MKHLQVRPDAVELIRRDYSANSGWETFLAYEDPRQDVLVGLLRLRQVSGRSDKERQPELRGRCCAMSADSATLFVAVGTCMGCGCGVFWVLCGVFLCCLASA